MNLLQIFAEARADLATPRTQLAILFPPRQGYAGAQTTIAQLRWVRSHENRVAGMRLIFARNMADYSARGKGSKAAKRAAKLSYVH